MAVAVLACIIECSIVAVIVAIEVGRVVAEAIWVAIRVACCVSVGRGFSVAGLGLVETTDADTIVSTDGVTANLVSVLCMVTLPTVGSVNSRSWHAAKATMINKRKTRLDAES